MLSTFITTAERTAMDAMAAYPIDGLNFEQQLGVHGVKLVTDTIQAEIERVAERPKDIYVSVFPSIYKKMAQTILNLPLSNEQMMIKKMLGLEPYPDLAIGRPLIHIVGDRVMVVPPRTPLTKGLERALAVAGAIDNVLITAEVFDKLGVLLTPTDWAFSHGLATSQVLLKIEATFAGTRARVKLKQLILNLDELAVDFPTQKIWHEEEFWINLTA